MTNQQLYQQLKYIEESIARMQAIITEAQAQSLDTRPLHFAAGQLVSDKRRILADIGGLLYRCQPQDGPESYHWFIKDALKAGGDNCLVWRGEMCCAIVNPTLDGVEYTADYKAWYQDQQTAMERVMG